MIVHWASDPDKGFHPFTRVRSPSPATDKLEVNKVQSKNFFYAFCHLYAKSDSEGFALFMQKTFLHYYTAFNAESNIYIDHKEMCHTLAKSKKVTIKESFGEETERSFFKILLDKRVIVDERGKRIKTLRKKAYRKLFYYLIELGEKEREAYGGI